jgi:hypothetical protein
MVRIKSFGKQSILAGLTHNDSISKKFVDRIFKTEMFDYYLVELNLTNKAFIEKNKLYISEFYTLCIQADPMKLKLIDMELKDEVGINSKRACKFEDTIISYELEKFIFFKLCNNINTLGSFSEDLQKFGFFNTHIVKREEYMLTQINKYIQNKVLIIVGDYHFDYISTNLI